MHRGLGGQDVHHVDAYGGSSARWLRPELRHRRRADGVGNQRPSRGGGCFRRRSDESDGTFVAFSPEIAVVTNVGADHLDFYGTKEAYAAAFDKFAARIQKGGVLIVCAD